MRGILKQAARRLRYGHRATSESYLRHLKSRGASIGKQVTIYAPETVTLDDTCPCLLTIGDHVTIAQGVTVLTHDYAWAVLRHLPEHRGRILGAQSPVRIGNHVFIGIQAILTRGIAVGDNVIIGAGSVVTGDCEANSVYAGNPARKIMTLEAYCRKREDAQWQEARALAQAYRHRFGKVPPRELFREYFPLFSTAEEARQEPVFRKQLELGGDFEWGYHYLQTHPPRFSGFDEFRKECFDP